jgi:hypothetical protein
MNFGIRGVSTLDSFSKVCTDTALKALDLKIMRQAAIHLEEYQLASACGDTTGVILCGTNPRLFSLSENISGL